MPSKITTKKKMKRKMKYITMEERKMKRRKNKDFL